jgi:hypothetical protein
MRDINGKQLEFRILEETDIEECAEFIGNIFAQFSSFASGLKYSPIELKASAKAGLNSILGDKLTVIALDSNNKIIGCWAGIKLSKIRAFKSGEFKKRENLIFNIDIDTIKIEEKNSVMSELEYIFLKPYYEKLLLNNEDDLAVYGRYFCISVEYFGTPLAKKLAIKFFSNCIDKKIKHCYGIVFNIKVFQLLTKYFHGEILNEFKVTFKTINDISDLDAFLFYGSADKSKLFIDSKF